MKSYVFRYVLPTVRGLLFVAAVVLAIVAIWAPENRMKTALTALVILSAWGVWLAVERTNPHNTADSPKHPVE
ncbi:MAG: hypothetical protein V9G08_14320 [Dermatophilaceae bacterium]